MTDQNLRSTESQSGAAADVKITGRSWDPAAAGRRAVERHAEALRRLADDPEEGDRLSLMRHWVAYPVPGRGSSGPHVCGSEEARDTMAKAGWRVEGPFVPEPPEGAVEALRAIRQATRLGDPIHREYPLVKRIASIADDALRDLGGQYTDPAVKALDEVDSLLAEALDTWTWPKGAAFVAVSDWIGRVSDAVNKGRGEGER